MAMEECDSDGPGVRPQLRKNELGFAQDEVTNCIQFLCMSTAGLPNQMRGLLSGEDYCPGRHQAREVLDFGFH